MRAILPQVLAYKTQKLQVTLTLPDLSLAIDNGVYYRK
jgi:hypothetical protein